MKFIIENKQHYTRIKVFKCILGALSLVLLVVSCGKIKERTSANESNEELEMSHYQKEIAFDGLHGDVDSIVSTKYLAEEYGDEIISWSIKRFNQNGFITNEELKEYEDGKLLSAKSILYQRDSIGLQSSQLINYLSNAGIGYTVQYNLVHRNVNEETWEYIRKMPGKDVELSAEIREYTKGSKKVMVQVGNTDSTTIRFEYQYNEKGLMTNLTLYDQGRSLSQEKIEYNKEYFPSKITTSGKGLGNLSVEKIEYQYDDSSNPSVIDIYRGDNLVARTYNEIYYRRK